MRKRKHYLYLTAEEQRYIFTDVIDEVKIKLQK